MNGPEVEITKTDVDERLQVLEGKVTFQDRTIDELNQVLTKQQDQVDLLTTQLTTLRETLDSALADASGTVEAGEEPPPPHY
ncbi:MAG: SlyX protein [Myxococcota bacterium]|jgi:SlyX protein